MKREDFRADRQPHCHLQPQGYFAFYPPPLPPKLDLDWALVALLSEADRAMAELSGAGQLLPNPHLLIRPYLRREAILSSRIENTIAQMEELALFEAQNEEAPKRPDIQEVANYVRALETGLQRLSELPICTRLICELHAVLLKDVRGGEPTKTPGEYRRSQNWIGKPGALLNEATFVPPPPDEMQRALGSWENYINAETPEPALIKAALLHYQFEAIHPFLDGNGRIGRALITLFLCSRKCLSQPLLYLSGYFDETRDDYYRLLLGVSLRGQWREWVEYFLRGVRQQARAALADTQSVLRLYSDYREKLKQAKRPPQAAAVVLDELFGTPVFSISRYCDRTGAAFINVSKGVEFWVRHGLLQEFTGQKRHRLFIALELMRMMEPPHPVPAAAEREHTVAELPKEL
jgi:Fic family protein